MSNTYIRLALHINTT